MRMCVLGGGGGMDLCMCMPLCVRVGICVAA